MLAYRFPFGVKRVKRVKSEEWKVKSEELWMPEKREMRNEKWVENVKTLCLHLVFPLEWREWKVKSEELWMPEKREMSSVMSCVKCRIEIIWKFQHFNRFSTFYFRLFTFDLTVVSRERKDAMLAYQFSPWDEESESWSEMQRRNACISPAIWNGLCREKSFWIQIKNTKKPDQYFTIQVRK
jgi:hypothetical protein